jgi:hypothetical protein
MSVNETILRKIVAFSKQGNDNLGKDWNIIKTSVKFPTDGKI